jgi:outer membrane lipoprotein-sorting protein
MKSDSRQVILGKALRPGRFAGALAAMLVYLCLASAAIAQSAAQESMDARSFSRELDRLFRSETSEGLVEMSVVTPHYQRTLSMRIWSRGLDYNHVRILSPKKEKGVSSLRRDNDMWNYLPKIKKTIRIPPSMMMGSWMGSDFTNDDLVQESSWEDDYDVRFGEPPADGQVRLVYTPREDAVVTWDRVEIAFERESRLPLWQDYYDEKGRKTRRMSFSEVRRFGDRLLPATMTLTPFSEEKKGNRTVVRYLELTFDDELPAEMFTLGYLRGGR